MTDLERDLVNSIRTAAKAMNVMLVEMGQRRAKGSGSTIGLPDLAVICNGLTEWIECKRAEGGVLSIGQVEFIRRAAERGVTVHVVDSLTDFVDVVNGMRTPRGRGLRGDWRADV